MDASLLELARHQAEICKTFGSATRILILWVLGNSELSVSEIAQSVDLSIQNASQHLLLMKSRGILTSRREGQVTYYSICRPEVLQGCTVLCRAVQRPLNSESLINVSSSDHKT
mgnify:CR=1 FL=1